MHMSMHLKAGISLQPPASEWKRTLFKGQAKEAFSHHGYVLLFFGENASRNISQS